MTADGSCRDVTPRTIEDLLAALIPMIGTVRGIETVPLRAARGHVLARDIVAAAPVPHFARSAVDGYALREADLTAPGDLILPVVGRLAAGEVPSVCGHGPGALRIFTGAAVPSGYDRVVMQEDCRAVPGAVHIRRLPAQGDNIRPVGDDLAAGQRALAAGTLLDGRHLGVAASLGRTELQVVRRLRVAVLSTGSELVQPGLPLGPAAIHASNALVIAAMLEQAGFAAIDLGIVPDDPAHIDAALHAAAGADVLVTSGGVSVGDEDHVRTAVERVGGRIDHWRLAIKPGKPIAVGRLPGTGGDLLFIGLPGNPNAVFTTLALIGLPLLRARAGQPQRRPHPVTVRIAQGWRRSAGRREYVPVRLTPTGDDGVPAAERLGSGGSAQQSALAAADALLLVPPDATSVCPGDLMQALPIDTIV